MKVGHSTQQRLVGRQSLALPEAKQAVAEVSVDGGKVRLRHLEAAESPWRDYKAVRLGGIYYGGFFQDNAALIDVSQLAAFSCALGLFRRWTRWRVEYFSGDRDA